MRLIQTVVYFCNTIQVMLRSKMKFSIIVPLTFAFITLCEGDVDERIFLTNLLEEGKIHEAKQRALVKHPEIENVESYAGYVTINKKYNSNTFFWYFPSQEDPQNAPLVLWMNGGPGASSLFGLFVEHGPFLITENKTVEMREYSWNKNHNVLYIDNPVGAGFSFTDDDRGYPRTEDEIGRDIVTALVQFFKLFSELKDNDFYVTGESYAGKYVPAVSKAIKTYNENTQSKINMKGLVIANGWVDPINHLVYSDLLYNIGLLDSRDRDQFREVEEKSRYHIERKEYTKASVLINSLFNGFWLAEPHLFQNLTGFTFPYNYLYTDEPLEYSRYIHWVERCDVRQALHVGNTKFESLSQVVAKHLLEDVSISHASYVAELLKDYQVLIYNGQLDIAISFMATENFIDHLSWSGVRGYKKAVKKLWRVGNDLAGYAKVVGNLNLILVRKAGHLVPTDQPLWAWDLITRFTYKLGF